MKLTTQSRSVGALGSAGELGAGPEARKSERGSALLAALCFASVLTIALGSYMTLCYRTLQMSSRTLQGTQAVQLAETGMEDALWALNKNDWSSWTVKGTTATKKITGFTFDNNVTGQIDLTITSFDGSAGARTITVSGTTQSATGTTSTRTLTSTSAKAPLFVNAIAGTTGRVKFLSAGTVDSYDSTLGSYASQTAGYSAVVASGTTYTLSAAVQMTNVQIKGYVATLGTGPSYSSTARLYGPATPGTTKIDPDRISTSPYQPIFDELPASGTSTLLPTGTATIGTPGATTPTNYHATDVVLASSEVLTINGPVVLTIGDDLSITDSAKIRITTTGSLEIHIAGDLVINGNGIQNDTTLPKKLAIIGSEEENDALGMATNTPFYGVIYTPNSTFTVYNSQAIYGAIVARRVTFNGSPAFHYDVSLRNTTFAGIETPYAVSDWRETSAGN